MGIDFNFGGDYEIEDNEIIKLTEYAGVKEAKVSKSYPKQNNLKNCKRLSSTEYYDKRDGKVKKYKLRSYRTKENIQNSMKKARDYLKNNFDGSDNEIFVTLTYADEMRDMNKLKKDYDYFWKRLKKQYQDLEYLYVVEMQENRKSLHLHILLKDPKHSKLFIPHEEIERLWNKGIIWVSRINMKDTIQLLSKENKDEKTAIGRVITYMTKPETKLSVPRHKNIYSKSNGIVNPKTSKMTKKNANQFCNDNDYEFQYGYAGRVRSSGITVSYIKCQIYKKKEKKKE